MLENLKGFFKKIGKKEEEEPTSKDAAKERLHLVLMQDRANVSVDFLDMMKQEIIDVMKKYIDVDESEIDVRLTNQINDDGTNGAPALYANIPIMGIKSDFKHEKKLIEDQTKQMNENNDYGKNNIDLANNVSSDNVLINEKAKNESDKNQTNEKNKEVSKIESTNQVKKAESKRATSKTEEIPNTKSRSRKTSSLATEEKQKASKKTTSKK